MVGRIGIVTPYKQQLHELKKQFRNVLSAEAYNVLDINTVVCVVGGVVCWEGRETRVRRRERREGRRMRGLYVYCYFCIGWFSRA